MSRFNSLPQELYDNIAGRLPPADFERLASASRGNASRAQSRRNHVYGEHLRNTHSPAVRNVNRLLYSREQQEAKGFWRVVIVEQPDHMDEHEFKESVFTSQYERWELPYIRKDCYIYASHSQVKAEIAGTPVPRGRPRVAVIFYIRKERLTPPSHYTHTAHPLADREMEPYDALWVGRPEPPAYNEGDESEENDVISVDSEDDMWVD